MYAPSTNERSTTCSPWLCFAFSVWTIQSLTTFHNCNAFAPASTTFLNVPRETSFLFPAPVTTGLHRRKIFNGCQQTKRMSSSGGTHLYGMRKEDRPSESEGKDDDDDDNKNASDGKSFDVENARKKLESLIKVSSNNDNDSATASSSNANNLGDDPQADEDNDDSQEEVFDVQALLDPERHFQLPPPPPMTSIERDRRSREIAALEGLASGDEATQDLWDLWFAERGPKPQKLLKQADKLLEMGGNFWSLSEELLLKLIAKYGVYWVEPLNRLATLYFLQGRMDESYKLCRVVLQIKPWHFGALSGIVMVQLAKGDREDARAWAERKLPNFVASSSFPPFDTTNGPPNPERLNWVQKAVANAKEALVQAEEQTRQDFYGQPEDYYTTSISKKASSKLQQEERESKEEEGDSDIWQ
mmetsp:Transcript_25586/g.39333  ORF Transcript_25586/g.39333 Transcript_25586/m.39333 type:complete len:416 (-) Transcript_25586:211-1458(-)